MCYVLAYYDDRKTHYNVLYMHKRIQQQTLCHRITYVACMKKEFVRVST